MQPSFLWFIVPLKLICGKVLLDEQRYLRAFLILNFKMTFKVAYFNLDFALNLCICRFKGEAKLVAIILLGSISIKTEKKKGELVRPGEDRNSTRRTMEPKNLNPGVFSEILFLK